MRTWKREYCGRKNPNERLDCRKCGCDRPDDEIYNQPGVTWGNVPTYSSGGVFHSTASCYLVDAGNITWTSAT